MRCTFEVILVHYIFSKYFRWVLYGYKQYPRFLSVIKQIYEYLCLIPVSNAFPALHTVKINRYKPSATFLSAIKQIYEFLCPVPVPYAFSSLYTVKIGQVIFI